MTAFYSALYSLGVEEAEETEKVIQVVENGKRREAKEAAEDMDMFTRLVQPGRVIKLYDAEHPANFDQKPEPEQETKWVDGLVFGFLCGLIAAVIFGFLYYTSTL